MVELMTKETKVLKEREEGAKDRHHVLFEELERTKQLLHKAITANEKVDLKQRELSNELSLCKEEIAKLEDKLVSHMNRDMPLDEAADLKKKFLRMQSEGSRHVQTLKKKSSTIACPKRKLIQVKIQLVHKTATRTRLS